MNQKETVPIRFMDSKGVKYVSLADVVELLRVTRIFVVEEVDGDAKRIGVDYALTTVRQLQELPQHHREQERAEAERHRRWRKAWTGR